MPPKSTGTDRWSCARVPPRPPLVDASMWPFLPFTEVVNVSVSLSSASCSSNSSAPRWEGQGNLRFVARSELWVTWGPNYL